MSRNSKAFTLIEVTIVLAISSLIFVIVFLAVGQAQQSRRDAARQSAASRFIAAAEQYANNNNGALPANGWNGTNYFVNSGNPSSTNGQWAFGTTPAPGTLAFTTNVAPCAGGAPSPRIARVQTTLEDGTTVYCRDNL